MSVKAEFTSKAARGLAWLGLALLTGCVAVPAEREVLDRRDALLSGQAVFGESVTTTGLEPVDILSTTPEMDAFVASVVGDTRLPTAKFRRLLSGLADAGYFTENYVADITRTAAETFERRKGNCLSYTTMFIALARTAGLKASYQVVDVPPSWDADSGYLIRYTHVNVLLGGFSYDTTYGREFSVDFNDVLPEPDYPRRTISDREATALFYANRSVAQLRSGETRNAFVNLKKAIELDPDNPDLWINLGAFYAKQEAYGQAIDAYSLALYHDPHNRGAISGLVRANQVLGNETEAERYETLARRYRDRNPYFHYALAQAEYESAHYDEALAAINTAIDLKYRSGRFHFLKGLTEYQLGDLDSAQESFRRASRYGNYRDLKKRYVSGVAQVEPFG